MFLSDEGPTLETLDYIGSTPTFLYFDLYLYSAYAAHYVYNDTLIILDVGNEWFIYTSDTENIPVFKHIILFFNIISDSIV